MWVFFKILFLHKKKKSLHTSLIALNILNNKMPKDISADYFFINSENQGIMMTTEMEEGEGHPFSGLFLHMLSN